MRPHYVASCAALALGREAGDEAGKITDFVDVPAAELCCPELETDAAHHVNSCVRPLLGHRREYRIDEHVGEHGSACRPLCESDTRQEQGGLPLGHDDHGGSG